MNKKIITAIIVLVLIIPIIFTVAAVCIHNTYINKRDLAEFEKECDVEVAIFHGNSVEYKDENIYLFEILPDDSPDQAYCVINGDVYYSYQYKKDGERHICLAFTNINEKTVNVVLDEVFGDVKQYNFNIDASSAYKNRNGYYYNNKIVLTDFNKVIEYDVLTTEYKICDYAVYEHPDNSVESEISDDNKSVTIRRNDDALSLDIDKFRGMSDIAEYVISNYDRKTVGGLSTFSSFFDDVQVIDDKIYLVCEVLNWGGHSYELVFSVDLTNNKVEYITWYFTSGSNDTFLVVPVINEM